MHSHDDEQWLLGTAINIVLNRLGVVSPETHTDPSDRRKEMTQPTQPVQRAKPQRNRSNDPKQCELRRKVE